MHSVIERAQELIQNVTEREYAFADRQASRPFDEPDALDAWASTMPQKVGGMTAQTRELVTKRYAAAPPARPVTEAQLQRSVAAVADVLGEEVGKTERALEERLLAHIARLEARVSELEEIATRP